MLEVCMALVTSMSKITKDRVHVHEEVDCTYLVFHDAGEAYLQLDTYGSTTRAIPGKVSQSVQLNAAGARQLRALIDRTFGTGK
jgi:hypothetical protein